MKKVLVLGVVALAYTAWTASPALSVTCGGAPKSGCRTALKSILLIKDNSDDTKDKAIFKWLKGAATVQADFGVPTGTTTYALCVYAGTTETLIAQYAATTNASLWTAISDKGYKLKDLSGTPDGVQKVILKGGVAGKAKTLVKGKGANLPDPTHPVAEPVRAQLVHDDPNNVCFEGSFSGTDVIKNDTSQFKGKAQ